MSECPLDVSTLDMLNLTGAVFLDRNGFWAKREEDVTVVRLYVGEAVSAEMTFAQFQSLPEEQQEVIRNAGTSVKVNL
jgi:hypothetical protein